MTFQEISFQNDKAKYITPSWDQLDELTLQVAKQVKQSQINFDLIIALAKGAWPMSRSFFDYTGIKELASLGVKFYSGINKRLGKPNIYQKLPTSIKGKSILVFDDVSDTGDSLDFTKQYLIEQGAKEVRTATLFMKPWSAFTPDFYGADTDAWIIFPFEKKEMSKLLGVNWEKQGADKKEIMKRFQQLGFKKVLENVG